MRRQGIYGIWARAAAFVLAAVVLLAACERGTGTSPPERPSRSATHEAAVVSCRGLRVPGDREINTNLDQDSGLLEFSYYNPPSEHDRRFTISYFDPACLANRDTSRLLEHSARAANRYSGRCDERSNVYAHVDGDGRLDLVYHDWVMGAAEVGVCTGDGRASAIAGTGQSELLSIIDLDGDGRDEIFFGATTIAARAFSVAVFRGRLEAVKLESHDPFTGLRAGDRLVMRAGLVAGLTPKGATAGWAFGCEVADGGRRGTLVQVAVEDHGNGLRWTELRYRISRSSAILIGSRRRGIGSAGPERDLALLARRMVAPCDVKTKR